jgi:hypothetical protein
MTHDPKADPYIALRRLVETHLNKGRTLRDRVRELRWKRVKGVTVAAVKGVATSPAEESK